MRAWREKEDDNPESTSLYQIALTLKEYHITPFDWRRLSEIDRKILIYSRIMEDYYMTKSRKKMEKRMENERNRQRFMASLPKVGGRR